MLVAWARVRVMFRIVFQERIWLQLELGLGFNVRAKVGFMFRVRVSCG